MERQNYLKQYGVSVSDWELTPKRVKRLVEALLERTEQQAQELKEFQVQNEDLKEQLNRDSINSSNPPSSDRQKRRQPKRNSSGRQRGGQPGHEGHQRQLYPVEQCETVEDYYPSVCWQCGASVEREVGEVYRHQIVEIPPIVPQIKEYRLHQCVCEHCQCLTRATLPATVSRKGFGPRLVATVAVLSGMHRQSQRLVQRAMSDLFGIDLALGSVNNLRHEASDAVERPVEVVQRYIQQQRVVGADETGFVQGNVDGNNPHRRKAWLWVAVTPLATVFQVTLSRSQQSAQDLLGQPFSGILISDRHSAYTWVDVHHRQLCWAHLKRDFTQIAERSGVSQTLGTSLLAQERQLFKLWYRVRDGTMSRREFVSAVAPLRQRVKDLLTQGAAYVITPHERTPLAKTVRTCRRLLKLEPAMWLFVTVEGVEPTNNESERAIRPAVIWRRVSFGAQTQAGSIFMARMLTVGTTLRSQNRNVLEYMTEACQAARDGKPAPSLLPQNSIAQGQRVIAA